MSAYLFGPWDEKCKISENAMFGLDVVLECRMGQTLNPPRVLPGLKENAPKKALGKFWYVYFTMFHSCFYLSSQSLLEPSDRIVIEELGRQNVESEIRSFPKCQSWGVHTNIFHPWKRNAERMDCSSMLSNHLKGKRWKTCRKEDNPLRLCWLDWL